MVVTIIAILSAIAVPQLLPEVHKANVSGGAELVASALGRARGEAMLSKRCVRVWIDSTNARRLVTERLNTFDCDTTPGTFPGGFGGVGLDGVNRVWSPVSAVVVDGSIQLSLTAPSDTAACSTATGSVSGVPAGFPCAHVVFRPNGRVLTFDVDPDDDAVVNVAHTSLGPTQSKNILVNSNGLICVLQMGRAPLPGLGAGDFVCPP